jgi:hypothetical protein
LPALRVSAICWDLNGSADEIPFSFKTWATSKRANAEGVALLYTVIFKSFQLIEARLPLLLVCFYTTTLPLVRASNL